MGSIFNHLWTSVLAVFTSAAVVVSPVKPSPSPSVTPAPVIKATPGQYYTAEGSFTALDKTAHYVLEVPKNGGPITGSFDGDCSGNITGTNSNNVISGELDGTCTFGIFKPAVKATYAGEINPKDKQMTINYQLTSPYSQSGSQTLDLK